MRPQLFARISPLLTPLLLALVLFCAVSPSAGTAEPPTQKQIEAAIERLGSDDPSEREEASKFLWSAGHAAEPLLRAVVADKTTDPETLRRAREILNHFKSGITPDAPAEVLELVNKYRAGDNAERRAAVRALTRAGAPGIRVMLRLHDEEPDLELRQIIEHELGTQLRPAAASLLSKGEVDAAESILAAPLQWSEQKDDAAIRDYAAFLLLKGRLNDAIAEHQRINGQSRPVLQALTFFHRAAGDTPAALQCAKLLRDDRLLEALLLESGDFKTLHERMAAKGPSRESIDELGFMLGYALFAGIDASIEQRVQEIKALAAAQPDLYPVASELLMLAGRPDDAVRVLTDSRAYSGAMQYQMLRLRFDEVTAIHKLAAQKTPDDQIVWIDAQIASMNAFLGRREEAATILDALIDKQPDEALAPAWPLCISTARRMHDEPRTRRYLERSLQLSQRSANPALFEAAGFEEPLRATQWWKIISARSRDPIPRRLALLRTLTQTIEQEELTKWSKEARDYASTRPAQDAAPVLIAVAETLAQAKRTDEEIQTLEQLASQSPLHLLDLGRAYARAKRWDKAAAAFEKAWKRDQTKPLPLFLHGNVLLKQGQEEEGRKKMELAHLLPLGDTGVRHEFMLGLSQDGFADDARRERDLIIRIGRPASMEYNDALRRAGDEANENGDFSAAVALWRRAFIENFGQSTSFVEPSANVAVPALILRTQALAEIKAGRIELGVKWAKRSFLLHPSDTDAVIDIVNALDAAQHRAQADEMFTVARDAYKQLCVQHPDSASLHNQFAWAAAKCKRDLDDAVAHAKRAAALEPTETAILDTLAETYFARGEVKDAIQWMQRCVDLEPDEQQHKEKLAKFKAAGK